MNARIMRALAAGAAVTVLLAACGSAASPSPAASASAAAEPSTPPASVVPSAAPALVDIVDTATAAGSFKTLLTAATAAGLVDTLKGAGPYTVFAPTDEAFAALPAGTLDSLLADPAALKNILLYHVVAGSVTSDKVVGLTEAASVAGPPIAIKVIDGAVVLNGESKVVTPDVMTSNGVIHVIDKVILPPNG